MQLKRGDKMGRYKNDFTLYKRGKYWYYQTYDFEGVRTTPKSTGKTTKYEAAEWCKEKLKNNALLTPRLTVEEYAQRFFAEDGIYFKDRATPVSESTKIQVLGFLRREILPYFAKMNVCEIRQTHVKEFRIYLKTKGLANSSIRNALKPLAFMMRQLFNDGIIQRNPCIDLPVLEKPSKRDSFTYNEIKELYKRSPDDIKPYILIMALTGVRQGEAFAITKADLFFDSESGFNYFHLYQQEDRFGKLIPLKTRDERNCPIIPELKDFFARASFCRSRLYEQTQPIIRSFENWNERKLALHSIRHFFITDCKVSGINPQLVEVYSGHSLRGIENVYTHYKIKDFGDILKWQEKVYNDLLN